MLTDDFLEPEESQESPTPKVRPKRGGPRKSPPAVSENSGINAEGTGGEGSPQPRLAGPVQRQESSVPG